LESAISEKPEQSSSSNDEENDGEKDATKDLENRSDASGTPSV
jgi:hypothetical protein